MLECAYAIFTTEANVNATTKQVSAKNFFSHLTMEGPGTTEFSFVVGVWGIPSGKGAAFQLVIDTPNGKRLTGKWSVKESKDTIHVYNAIFNCAAVPLEIPGLYKFSLVDQQTKKEFAKRILKVTFSDIGGGKEYE